MHFTPQLIPWQSNFFITIITLLSTRRSRQKINTAMTNPPFTDHLLENQALSIYISLPSAIFALFGWFHGRTRIFTEIMGRLNESNGEKGKIRHIKCQWEQDQLRSFPFMKWLQIICVRPSEKDAFQNRCRL